MSKVFIDTNILVYALDKNDERKRTTARAILGESLDEHQLVISTQVLKEFYVVATSKLRADPIVVKGIIHSFGNMEIVNNDLELVEQAIDISVVNRISFWDSLIVAAAEKARCEYIMSEDLNAGQSYRGIVVVNPFKDGFNI